MGQHCAKGRYLDPENFSKELVLNFNLGPLKDLDGLIDKVLKPNLEKMPWHTFSILNFGFGIVSDFLQFLNPWLF